MELSVSCPFLWLVVLRGSSIDHTWDLMIIREGEFKNIDQPWADLDMGCLPPQARDRQKCRRPYGVYTCRDCGLHPLTPRRLSRLAFGQPVRDGRCLSGVADESGTDSRCVRALAVARRRAIAQPVCAGIGGLS